MSQLSTSTEMGTLQPVFDDPAIHVDDQIINAPGGVHNLSRRQVKKLKKKAKKAIARAINNYHQQQVVTADMLEARLHHAADDQQPVALCMIVAPAPSHMDRIRAYLETRGLEQVADIVPGDDTTERLSKTESAI
ncbi:hypothetical protein EV363DRAFT_1448690 [Boletus edulis]|nr:hypothetical protein EV363DRAFT_1448690 [Boletus edulis]